jgi:hypothetical protein
MLLRKRSGPRERKDQRRESNKFDIKYYHFIKLTMSPLKNFVNISLTLGLMTGLSYGSYQFCNWYGCNGLMSFLRSDLICNACVDAAYHLKNYQISLYGSAFTLISYKLSSLISKASAPTDTYIFEDYDLGRNSPRSLKLEKN